jgi:hypothetical protein
MDKILTAAILTGAVGDSILQVMVKNSTDKNLYGLKTYFDKHGSLESIFIAAGMTSGLVLPYSIVDPDLHVEGLVIYGAVLDIIFRRYHEKIMPSLADYYKTLDPLMSIFWAIIPLLMVKGVSIHLDR